MITLNPEEHDDWTWISLYNKSHINGKKIAFLEELMKTNKFQEILF